MSVVHTPSAVEVAAGTAFELLAELAAASRVAPEELPDDLRAPLEAVGDGVGESWLNLLGVALDAGSPYTADRLLEALRKLDPVELRRVLLGRYAWSWCTLAGRETIEAAAEGDMTAADALLAHERYYAGQARASLSTILRLDAAETRRAIADGLEIGARTLDADARMPGDAAGAAELALAEAASPDAIERLTEGYRYMPEPEAERVVLIPHSRPEPWLVLAQHRATRLIVYRARAARGAEQRVATLGRALADPKRVEILSLVTHGVDRVAELVARTGLSRSTVHHHLSELREARLVDLEGNARAYRYVPRPGALPDAVTLLSEVFPRSGDVP